MRELLSRENVASITSHHYGTRSELLIRKTYDIVNSEASQAQKVTTLRDEVQRLIGVNNNPARLTADLMLRAGYRLTDSQMRP